MLQGSYTLLLFYSYLLKIVCNLNFWCQNLFVYDCIKLISNMFLNVCFFLFESKFKKSERCMQLQQCNTFLLSRCHRCTLFSLPTLTTSCCLAGSMRLDTQIGSCRPFQEIFNMHVAKCMHKYCQVCDGAQCLFFFF